MVRLFAIKDDMENPVLFTPWSWVHFTSGCAAKQGFYGVGPFTIWEFEIIHGLYEFKDQFVSKQAQEGKSEGPLNSLQNSVGDQIIATLGHLYARRDGGSFWATTFLISYFLAGYLGDSIS